MKKQLYSAKSGDSMYVSPGLLNPVSKRLWKDLNSSVRDGLKLWTDALLQRLELTDDF